MRLSWTSRFRIRRCIAGGALPCGCSVGAYELRDGTNVWVVDEPDARCGRIAHRRNTILNAFSVGNDGSAAHEPTQTAPPTLRDALTRG